jgi:hypothetical protein
VPAIITNGGIHGGRKHWGESDDGEERRLNKRRKFQHPQSRTPAKMTDPPHVISDDEDMRIGTPGQSINTASVGRRSNASRGGMKRTSEYDTTGAVSWPIEYANIENMLRPQSMRTRSNRNISSEYSPYFSQSIASIDNNVEVVVKRRGSFARIDHIDNFDGDGEHTRIPSVKRQPRGGNMKSKRSFGSGSDLEILHDSTENKRRKVQAFQSNNGARPAKINKVGISDIIVSGVELDSSLDDELATTTTTISRVNNRSRRRVTLNDHPETSVEIEMPETPSPTVSNLGNDIPASEVSHGRPSTKLPAKTRNRMKTVGSQSKQKNSSIGLKSLYTSDQDFEGPELSLYFNDSSGYYQIRRNGSAIDGAAHICPEELHKAVWCPTDFSTLVKVDGVRKEGRINMFYLDFERHEDAMNFLVQVKNLSVGFRAQSDSKYGPTRFSKESELTLRREKIEKIFTNRPRLSVQRTYHPAVDQGVEAQLLERNLTGNKNLPRPTTRISQMQVKPKDGYAVTHFNRLKRTDGAALENSLATFKHNYILDTSDSVRPALAKPKTRSSTMASAGSPLATERFSIAHGLGPEWEQPVVYPVIGKKKTYVEFGDLRRLDEGEFLNDNLIEFYLRWLQETKKTRDNEVYFFGTHFYSSLTTGKRGSINHDAVARWTAKVDIFNYDFVIVPVNESAHWYLALICNLPNLQRSFDTDDTPPSDLKLGLESILKAASQHTSDMTMLGGENMSKTNTERTLERQYAELSLDGDKMVTQTSSQLASPGDQVRDSVAEVSLVGESSDLSFSKCRKLTAQNSPEPNTQARNQNGIFSLAKLSSTPPKKGKAKSVPRKYDPKE